MTTRASARPDQRCASVEKSNDSVRETSSAIVGIALRSWSSFVSIRRCRSDGTTITD
jgi:hypothetical protein